MPDGEFRRTSMRVRRAKDLPGDQRESGQGLTVLGPRPDPKGAVSSQTVPWRIHQPLLPVRRGPDRPLALKEAALQPRPVPAVVVDVRLAVVVVRQVVAAVPKVTQPRLLTPRRDMAGAVGSTTSSGQGLFVSSSSSSGVRGQSSRNKRDRARSASSFPLVWQCGQ